MLNKTYKLILALGIATMALMTSALPVAAQNSYHNLRMENETGYPIYLSLLENLSGLNLTLHVSL